MQQETVEGVSDRGVYLIGLRLDLLQAFVVVAEELHFTKAALRLFLTQSGVSRRVDLLERISGQALLERTTRSVQLTEAGQVLLPHARAMLRSAAHMRADLDDNARRSALRKSMAESGRRGSPLARDNLQLCRVSWNRTVVRPHR